MSLISNLLPTKTNFDFVGMRKIGFAISLMIVIATIVMVTSKGLNFGIDFSGGILLEIQNEKKIDLAVLRSALKTEEFGEVTLQGVNDDHNVLIRVRAAGGDQAKIVERIKEIVRTSIGDAVEFRNTSYVGPQVGSELIESGFLALGLSLFAMLIYIWLRFEWQFGVGGVLALFHDAVATIGFFALTQLEFNLTSVAAVLTIIGYSINDSVVIYDRIRENMRKYKKLSLAEHINLSVNETISRTILTGGTVLLAVIGLIIFGGESLQSFSWTMLFGVIIGTYSSIFISAPVLLYTKVGVETMQDQSSEVTAQ